jgi:hypothetical protein
MLLAVLKHLRMKGKAEICSWLISGNCISSCSSTDKDVLTHVHFPDGHEQLAPQEQVHPGAVVRSAGGVRRVGS